MNAPSRSSRQAHSLPRVDRSTRVLLRAAGVALTVLASACGPRVVVEEISSSDLVRVVLRRTIADGRPVSRDYSHPVTISDVRLAHILANFEHRDAEGRRAPTIRSEAVYDLAEALNDAMGKASPDDEIAAVVFAENTRLALFTTKLATSFRVYCRGDELSFEFFDIERPLEPGEGKPGRDSTYDLPSAAPATAPAFQIFAPPSTIPDGSRTLHVAWRDPYFAKPVSLSVRSGRFRRRSVLLESDGSEVPALGQPTLTGEGEGDGEPADEPAPVGGVIRDAQLRALDQLDALRRSGLIKEADFQRRRRMVLEGKLEEAGYEPAPR